MTTVELDFLHPAFSDANYRARRDQIAAVAARQRPHMAPPRIAYDEAEHAVWSTVCHTLAPMHEQYACAEYRRAKAALALPVDEVPQLADVSDRLRELTGFTIEAVEGRVASSQFFEMLARRCFPSTQYLRHPSSPLYTPEPDMAHELIGHVASLASPRIADLYQAAGEAGLRARDEDELARLGKFYWFTFEFGVCREARNDRTAGGDGAHGSELVAYGAGLLSSFGELSQFRGAEIAPWQPTAMERVEYDITQYQPLLFAAGDFDQTADAIERHLATYGGER